MIRVTHNRDRFFCFHLHVGEPVRRIRVGSNFDESDEGSTNSPYQTLPGILWDTSAKVWRTRFDELEHRFANMLIRSSFSEIDFRTAPAELALFPRRVEQADIYVEEQPTETNPSKKNVRNGSKFEIF
jgi:hypothetical protein